LKPGTYTNHAGLGVYTLEYEHSGKSRIEERLRGTAWEGVKEINGGYEAFSLGDEKYCMTFGTNIIVSIPAGSIYFGGTDPGRRIITAMCKSQVKGDPFYVLTQSGQAVEGGHAAGFRHAAGGGCACGCRRVDDSGSGPARRAKKPEKLYVRKTVLLDQTAVKSAKAVRDNLGKPQINVRFTDAGRKRLAEVTRQSIHQRLAMVLDGRLYAAPVIQSEITGGEAVISGNFSDQEADTLAQKINDALAK
jgi:hypothetical protein